MARPDPTPLQAPRKSAAAHARMSTPQQSGLNAPQREAVRYLDILHPPARKLNLIQAGNVIKLIWVHELSSCDEMHRVGKYFYMGKTSYPLFDGWDDEGAA